MSHPLTRSLISRLLASKSARLGAAACAFAAALSFAPRAHAFCRTVTEAAPADFNPQSQGCFVGDAKAKVLFWRNACVGYSLQQDASAQVTLAEATTAMTNAFKAWTSSSCADGGHPSVSAVDEGPVACGEVRYNQTLANQHVIVFRDNVWPHSDPNNTLGLTTVTFDTDTGEIYDADMEINSTPQNKIVVSGTVPSGSFDFDSIVTHEAGHFLGLAHSTLTSAIMFAHYKPGAPQLTSDDVGGICTIYPSDGSRVTSAGSIHEDACDPTPRHGFASACDAPSTDGSGSTTKKGCSVAAAGAGAPSGVAGFAFLAIAAGLGLRRARRAGGARLVGMKRARATVVAGFLSLSVLGAASLVISDAQASVSIAVLFDELVRDASAAAVVTPMEQHAVWENGRIYTYTRVHVDTKVAGTLPDEPWVRTMGGTVGKIGQLVEGEAVLTVGRPSLLFLQPQVARTPEQATEPSGMFEVTARAQGQFPLTLDENKTSRLVHAFGVGALMPPPADRIARISKLRAGAGVPQLAQEVLHNRPVSEATRDIVAAWSRLHAQ